VFRYNVAGKAPWLHYSLISRDGDVLRSFPIPLPAPVMMHDCAITENYTIFFDMNMQFQIQRIFEGAGSPWVRRRTSIGYILFSVQWRNMYTDK
jgi:carotenoid cleavage dioxygenase-like enzyme